MALLDTSELLSDPDFSSKFDLIRTVQVVGDDGRVINTPTTTFGIIGVVQPASGQAQKMLPEGAYAIGSITVYTKYPVKQVMDGFAADQIVFLSALYTIETVNSWESYGEGYFMAICTLKDLVDE